MNPTESSHKQGRKKQKSEESPRSSEGSVESSEKGHLREEKNSIPLEKKQKKERQNQEEQVFEAYVGGLSYEAEESDLKELFKECGSGPSDCKLLRRSDKKSKGIAFVKFDDEESLNEALQLNGMEHMGRTIQVERAQAKGNQKSNNQISSENSDSKTIFVGNLS